MAETALSCAGNQVPKLWEAVKKLRDLPKEVAKVTDEFETLQAFINDADKVAEAEQDKEKRDRIRKRLMRLREAAFRTEDVIDEYMISKEKQPEDDPRCAALLCEAVEYVKTQILRLQIAYQIQDVKSVVREERDDFQKDFPMVPRTDDFRGNENSTWHKLRMDPLFIKEDEVIGFERPIQTLKSLLTEGRKERTVISVLGMAGLGKTTLSKQVFDRVRTDFECHALITVSGSYTVEGLLRDMTKKLCKETREDPPLDIDTMDRRSLIEVSNRLRNKRYVVLFDDVWNETFWDDIESAVIDDKNGSRILITTRDKKVVEFCKKSLFFEVYNLQPLSKEKSLELLCKKAFGNDFHGSCPKDYEEVGLDIVRKCECLPLAIVAIGGLLYRKCKSPPEWGQFSQNLSVELERNSELRSVTKILSLSYDDLPYNLRPCLLYFGMYPEDYEVKRGRLIGQWIAEGFVKHERGKTLEEVAQQHLLELISRSLVQVSSFTVDDKVRACRVHDSIHEMIRGKMNDTGFCQYIDEHDQLVSSGIIRRLAIASNSKDLSPTIDRSHVRSILLFPKEKLSEQFTSRLLAKYMPLKVLDFEDASLFHVPENLGSFIHLKYLSFRGTWLERLPNSIGELQNLETLDVRTRWPVVDIPKETTKLRKLRHLVGYAMSSVAVKDSLGRMTSLEEIRGLEIDPDGVVIRELVKLKQLKDLRLTCWKADCKTLSSSINEMQFLEQLYICVKDENHVIDLDIRSSQSILRKLHLAGILKEFPNWIPQLQNLVKLTLRYSKLTSDPLIFLKSIPNLLFLSFSGAYQGEALHFEKGGFQKLKELELNDFYKLRSIFIHRGALQSLKKLTIDSIPQLKTVPAGIQHLEKLQVLEIEDMPSKFQQRVGPSGEDHWMIQHVPQVQFVTYKVDISTAFFFTDEGSRYKSRKSERIILRKNKFRNRG